MRDTDHAEPLQAMEPPRLFRTADHACGYFPTRVANDLVIDPIDPRLAQHYPQALGWGFRRSGDILYRPHCRECQACVAVRIPVAQFRPDRSQRRNLARNADLEVRVAAAQRSDENLDLYRRYLATRHAGGGMDGHGAAEFDQFLVGNWSQTRFMEVRQRDSHRLLAVAVTDLVPEGLSAVYTFYDPAESARGLGTWCVLQQVQWAQRTQRAHLYLGYWIDGHAKMHYKRRFRPLQGFIQHAWQDLPD